MTAPRLLVVDDERDLRLTLRAVLEREGMAVVTAEDGVAAVAALRAARFDLVITDLRMPGLGGLDTIAALRAIDPGVRILVVTGYGTDDVAADCVRRGAWGFLRKPFDLVDLMELVRASVDPRASTGSS